MNDKVFVDTNVLAYAHDIDAGDKNRIAAEHVAVLWETRGGIISSQVLQEFYVTVTRKIPSPLQHSVARSLVSRYRVWQVELPTPDTVIAASEIEERYQISFWDSLIVAAAAQGGAEVLLTEGVNADQTVEGVRIVNPFAMDQSS